MWSAPVACPDCGQPSVRGARYCEKHVQNNAATAARREANTLRNRHNRQESVGGLYDRAPWKNFRDIVWRQNVVCQRLTRGVRCTNLSKIVHHLISPRYRPDLFTDPKNVVCLCAHCHPPDEGTPHWRVGVDYVATVWAKMIVG